MRLGLGTGSTADQLLDALGEALSTGALEDVAGVPTSERTAERARRAGIPLVSLEDCPELDLAIDGADEFDPDLELIKGLGGALLREKMIAQAARAFLVMVDDSKRVGRLGEKAPLPVEVVPFMVRAHEPFLRALGADPVLRRSGDGAPFRTDNGNLILDCRFAQGIADPAGLERVLQRRAGVVESGLFVGMTTEVHVAGPDGVRILTGGAA